MPIEAGVEVRAVTPRTTSPKSALRVRSVADVVCIGGLIVWGIASIAFSLLTAVLLAHPLLHLLLGGSSVALVSAGAYAEDGRLSFWLIVPLAIIGSAMFDPLFWWAGRRYGDQLGRLLVRHGLLKPGSVERGEGWAKRFGGWAVLASYYLPLPNIVIDAAVGAGGMPFWRFLLIDVVAALLWTSVLIGLGYGIGEPARHAVAVFSHYALWTTVGLIVVVALVVGWRRLGARAVTE